MNYIKKIISITIVLVITATLCVVGFVPAGASGTGAGLAEWALKAYNEGWSYVYGGSSAGTVDCSGLIYSYCGGDRVGTAQLNSATASGNVSSGIPRVHGLGLYQPGHVGVYVGNGMAVDARNEYYDVCYESVSKKAWTKWFKLRAVTYITDGWLKFNGNYYYYQDGQYVVNTTLTIGDEKYSFSSSGISNKTPSDMSSVANGNSNHSNEKATKATTQATTAPAQKVLKVGSSGNDVTKLQNRLTELGFYNDVVTGYFGEATEAAYKEFQKAAKVTVDGIAGESDLDILYSSSAPKANEENEETQQPTEAPEEIEEAKDDGKYSVGEQGDEVVNIQYQLRLLGYFYEDPTGYYGDLTSEAVSDFQSANGLKATGEVNKKTYKLLFSGYAVENPNYEEPTKPEVKETEATSPVQEEIANTNADNTTVNSVAEVNIEAAQDVIIKTNKVTKKALSTINNQPKAIPLPTEVQNQNFVLWLLLVLGIVTVIIGITLTVNGNKKYKYAHAKANKKRNENIRYW